MQTEDKPSISKLIRVAAVSSAKIYSGKMPGAMKEE
jgi:hypothetical protein